MVIRYGSHRQRALPLSWLSSSVGNGLGSRTDLSQFKGLPGKGGKENKLDLGTPQPVLSLLCLAALLSRACLLHPSSARLLRAHSVCRAHPQNPQDKPVNNAGPDPCLQGACVPLGRSSPEQGSGKQNKSQSFVCL